MELNQEGAVAAAANDLGIDRKQLARDLKKLIIEVANLQTLTVDQITDDAAIFGEGIGLDSIDLLEIVVHIEQRHGLKLQNDKQGQAALRSIDSLTDAIIAHRGQSKTKVNVPTTTQT